MRAVTPNAETAICPCSRLHRSTRVRSMIWTQLAVIFGLSREKSAAKRRGCGDVAAVNPPKDRLRAARYPNHPSATHSGLQSDAFWIVMEWRMDEFWESS